MIFNIVLAITLVVAFFMCISSYLLGIKHGKQLSNAIIPKLELSPIKTFKQHMEAKEVKAKQDLALQGLQNIANYNPYEVKEGE